MNGLERIGYSFPLWRFLAQRFDGASLFEHYGLTRLQRVTDVHDTNLPDPARDRLGIGYVMQADDVWIEYRRAYIMCADATHMLIIRNNSRYFGHDRLPHAVYCGLRIDDVSALVEADVQAPLIHMSAIKLLERFEAFDRQLSIWLTGQGRPHLHAFLQHKLKQTGKLWLGAVEWQTPPWQPMGVAALAPEFCLDEFLSRPEMQGRRLALLSGPEGDLPG